MNPVKYEIDEFQKEDHGKENLTVHFFPNSSIFLEDNWDGTSLNEEGKRYYDLFLKENAQRIKKVIISINRNEETPPYDFLGECLSKLENIEELEVHNEYDDYDPMPYLPGLGYALNQIASVEHLKKIHLDIAHLLFEFEDEDLEDEDMDDTTAHDEFIKFLKSCDPTSFCFISRNDLNVRLINDIHSTIFKYPHLKHVSIEHSELDPFWNVGANCFASFGKFFASPIIEELSISLSGKFYTTTYGRYLSPQQQLQEFARQLDSCSSLKKLTLNCKLLKFIDNSSGSEHVLEYSIDALNAISHSKTLESIDLLLPPICMRPGQEFKWAQFLRHFENSQLVNCNLDFSKILYDHTVIFDDWDIAILLNMAFTITQTNQKIKDAMIVNKAILFPKILDNDKTIVTYYYLLEEQRRLMDIRLFRVDLRVAHFMQQSLKNVIDIRIIDCFSGMLSRIMLMPQNSARFILPYLNQKDLSQLIKLFRGMLYHNKIDIFNKLYHRVPPLPSTDVLSEELVSISMPAAISQGETSLVHEGNLNEIITVDPFKGISIAFLLSKTNKGQSKLMENDYLLAGFINAKSLNSIVMHDRDGLKSVAHYLIMSSQGQKILAANDYYLAKLIQKDLLENRQLGAESLKEYLSKTPEGQKILQANEKPSSQGLFTLSSKISGDDLPENSTLLRKQGG